VISITEAQLDAWLSPVFWPFLRVLALFSVAPVFSMRVIPVRARVGLAFLIAVCAQESLSGQVLISLRGDAAVAAVLQQVIVGLSVGFAVRLVFGAVDLAGELIGLQMGLNFAAFFDPAANAQVSAVSRFFGYTVLLLFVVANGHLMVLMALIQSFKVFPLGQEPMAAIQQLRLHELGSMLFSSALWIALPMIGLLMMVNLTLGVISRVAPQMNIYAVGFPVTLSIGMLGIAMTMPVLDQPFASLMTRTLQLFGG
jgi:flagellar biosynthesis protein FliR